MPIDPYFSFNIRAEQINQAYFQQFWTYTSGSNLTIQNLAGGTAGTRGIYHTNYTDAASNTANINLLANISQFLITSPGSWHTTAYLQYTNPGPPVPSVYYDSSTFAYDDQEFHGTCKPVSLGDWVDHNSQDMVFGAPKGWDGYFVTAGLDPNLNKIGINVNSVVDVSPVSMFADNVADITSNMPPGVNSTTKIRLFAHPSWNNGSVSFILLIGWDNSSGIYLESYQWDGINLGGLTSNTISTNYNMTYTGQHDIHYLRNGNILLQTWNSSRTTGTVYEIDGNSLSLVASEVSTVVAYDRAYDVIGIRKTDNFVTYLSSLSGTLVTNASNVFSSGYLCYDALNHLDEPGVMYFGEQTSATTNYNYAFTYNSSGVLISYVRKSQSMNNSVTFTQIERTSPNVLVSFEGPNNSTRPLFRGVCDASIYKDGSLGIDYSDSTSTTLYCEDLTQMRHPASQDYTKVNDTNADPTIGGNNHLISVSYDLNISGWGHNLATKHWNFAPSVGRSAHHMYILYLGYYLDSTGTDSYIYIAVTGLNFFFMQGVTASSPPFDGGWISWCKFRIT